MNSKHCSVPIFFFSTNLWGIFIRVQHSPNINDVVNHVRFAEDLQLSLQ